MGTDNANIHPLIQKLLEQADVVHVTAENIDQRLSDSGHLLLFFTGDPVQHRETLDLAVIAPELIKAFSTMYSIRLGVLLPDDAKACQSRYGFRRWPTFVLLRDGLYLGAIEGMKTWEEYGGELLSLLQSEPKRPPTIGISVEVKN